MSRDEAEELLLQHWSAVERMLDVLVRRQGFQGDDAADAAGFVRLRLVQDDYAAVRSFRGEASLTTFLAVVMARLLRDHRVGVQGRWRPSAAAMRRGEVAMRLEALVRRDGLPLRVAAESLRSRGVTTLGDRELLELLNTIPERAPLRPEQPAGEAIDGVVGTSDADATVRDAEELAEAVRVRRALERVLGELPEEERLVVRLRFWHDMSVAEIARALGREQKPLYRAIERILAGLRERLRADGMPADARTVKGESDAA